MTREEFLESMRKAPQEFEALKGRLWVYIEAETKLTFGPADRERLDSHIGKLMFDYGGTTFWAREDTRPGRNPNLHKIAQPLVRVIELLDQDGNWQSVLAALGAPNIVVRGADIRALERVVERHDSLLRDLRIIAGSVPPPPPSAGPGKPATTKDLYALVDELAGVWENETNQPFKQSWSKKESHGKDAGQRTPMTNAARFVADIVDFIDPNRYGQLPKVMERVVKARKSKSGLRSSS